MFIKLYGLLYSFSYSEAIVRYQIPSNKTSLTLLASIHFTSTQSFYLQLAVRLILKTMSNWQLVKWVLITPLVVSQLSVFLYVRKCITLFE